MTDQTHTRSVDFELRDDGDGMTLAGYAAVFDSPTNISDWKGTYTETIARGAFARAVRQNPRPVVQFDHGQHARFGSIPIGALKTLKEDAKGLWMEARMHSGEFFQPIREAIESGAIHGMSFRFSVPEGGEDFDPATNTRTVTDVNLYELGPVVFPAYADTSVGVRSREIAKTMDDPEVVHDIINALFWTGFETRDTDPAEAASIADEEPVAEEPTEQVEQDTADPDPVSAPNIAARHATLYQVKTERALRRS